jgi:RNA polymerase sigma-70 factor (ECF subfamily)
MDTTRASLLFRVRNPRDSEAWNEFYSLYAPLLYRYARQRGLSRDDAHEVRDRCLEAIARRLPSFEYDRHKGGFRRWLRRVAESKTADVFRKRRERPAGSAELRRVPDRSPIPSDLWERHWENEHIRYCVERVRGSVPERSYEVFRLLAFDERSVPEGCACLALNPNQVYKAKSRVLAAVRQKMAELGLDEA